MKIFANVYDDASIKIIFEPYWSYWNKMNNIFSKQLEVNDRISKESHALSFHFRGILVEQLVYD